MIHSIIYQLYINHAAISLCKQGKSRIIAQVKNADKGQRFPLRMQRDKRSFA